MARYIQIDDSVASSMFRVPAKTKRVIAKFYYAGECEPTLIHDPTSIDGGEVVFFWDANVRSLLEGWWEMRLYADNCECGKYPVRIENMCTSFYEGSDTYDDCAGCDGLPKAEVGCKSVVCKPQRCDRPICPPDPSVRPKVYVPEYEIPDNSDLTPMSAPMHGEL